MDTSPGAKSLSKTTPRRSIPTNTSPAVAERPMAGSDVPSGGSSAPPQSPERPRKRKSGAGEDAAAPSPRRATRSSASALVDVDGAVAWARRAAAGALWAVRGRNRGIVDDDGPLGVILTLRGARSELKPDDPNSPYSKKQRRKGTRSSDRIAGLSAEHFSFLAIRKHIGVDPVNHQASVPEWVAPSEKDKADYKADKETSQKMGKVVRLLPISAPPKTRKAVDEDDKFKCKCSHPGSEACVGVHVKQASMRLKNQMGKNAFRNCGLDAMGEQVLKFWTVEDKKKLADIEKLIPQNNHENFMKEALKQFNTERTVDLANYYYNIFLPKRLASLTRAEAANTTDKCTDDDVKNQDDNNTGHRSEEKSGGSGPSSKRSRK